MNKHLFRETFLFVVGLTVIFASCWVTIWCIVQVRGVQSMSTKSLCIQYEKDGSIPKGSCECAAKLFPDFNKSYDWIDSCGILEAKTK